MSDCLPNFIPSGISCVLSTNSELKARQLVGGTLFRSVEVGQEGNSISVSNNWLVCIAGGTCDINNPTLVRLYNISTDIPCDVVATQLSVFDNGVMVEMYTVAQFNIICPGSPTPPVFSGIPGLRALLTGTGGQLVVMPPLDLQTPAVVVSTHTTWDASEDDTPFLSPFGPTLLTGGIGLNPNPTVAELDAIRTGPAFTLAHIGESESIIDPLNDGEIDENTSITRYWNGNEWVFFDINNIPASCGPLGSPPHP